MDGFTLIDGIVAIVIIMSGLLAYSRGLLREVMAIAGWVAATAVAFIYADQVRPLVRQIPYVGDILGDSCELLIIAGFALMFALSLVVISIFTPLLSTVVQRSVLNGADQLLGFFFGLHGGRCWWRWPSLSIKRCCRAKHWRWSMPQRRRGYLCRRPTLSKAKTQKRSLAGCACTMTN